LTADREAAGVGSEVLAIDHAQRRLSLMSVLDGGLEKMVDTEDLGPLKAAKKAAKAVMGKRVFLARDQVLNHRLVDATVPVEFRDGVRRLEYLAWADELVETLAASIAAGGAA